MLGLLFSVESSLFFGCRDMGNYNCGGNSVVGHFKIRAEDLLQLPSHEEHVYDTLGMSSKAQKGVRHRKCLRRRTDFLPWLYSGFSGGMCIRVQAKEYSSVMS